MKKGLHIHLLNYEARNEPVDWPPTNEEIWRTLDSGTGWGNVQPTKGAWDWSRLDKFVAEGLKRGKEIWHAAYFTPAWCASNLDAGGYGPGSYSTPDMGAWAQYCLTLVKRYKGRIKYYEGWNEWGRSGQTEQEAIDMQRVLYATVLLYDPQAKVISCPSPDVRKLESIASGIAPYCDALSHHFYELNYMTLDESFSRARASADRHRKPLWNSECGRIAGNGFGGGINLSDMTSIQKETYFSDMHRRCVAADLQGMIVHSWNGQMGFSKDDKAVASWNRT